MPESSARNAALGVGAKMLGHYDYFGYVIPAIWFLLGLGSTEMAVLKTSVTRTSFGHSLDVLRAIAGTPDSGVPGRDGPALSMAGQVLLAVAVALVLFQVIYILGHLLNGISALLIDRLVVRKLLKYPGRLYLIKCTEDGLSDHEVFRREVLNSSAIVTVTPNIAPWIAAIGTATLLQERGQLDPASLVGSTLVARMVFAATLSGAAVVLCLGVPRVGRAEAADASEAHLYRVLRHWHMWLILGCWSMVAFCVGVSNRLEWLLLPPVVCGLAVVTDRLSRDKTGEYRSANLRMGALYCRTCFVNWVYFIATLVDYGDLPERAVVERARRAVASGTDGATSDFFWLCWIRVQHGAPQLYATAYHFLSMYGMNRNLCGATGMVLAAGLAVLKFTPESVPNAWALAAWLAGLCALSVLFFARYLYLYGGYFTKFTVRAATVVGGTGTEAGPRIGVRVVDEGTA